MLRYALAAAALTAALPVAAAETNVWSTGFETGFFETIGPFSFSSLGITFGGSNIESSGSLPGTGTQFLRNPSLGTTSLSASGLGAHTALHLTFDLAFVDSWDGFDGSCCSPDYLNISVNGSPYLQLSSNNTLGSAPLYGPGTLTAFGNYVVNTSWNDALVHYDLLFTTSAPNFTIDFTASGAGYQGGDDESWGIDNFALSAITAGVPEPTSWALMIGGFGLTGAAMRRRRTVPA